jgi:diacylglycerol kinase (ATP)
MKKILLLLNPSSRQGAENFEHIEKLMQDKGWTLLNTNIDSKGKQFDELLELYGTEADVIVVGGGDGSINSALHGLVRLNKPMAILPLGTANNMARTLLIPGDIQKALDVIDENHIVKIDLGIVNGIYFVNVVGLGLSTQVNKTVSKSLKKWLGALAFVITAFRIARYLKPLKLKIECDGKTFYSKSLQITVCNGRNYGSGLVISDEATLTDEKLHCLSTEVKKWWHGFFLIPAMIVGKYKPTHDISLFEGKSMVVHTKKPRDVDVDGDIKTKTPIELSVKPKVLSVYTTRPQPVNT